MPSNTENFKKYPNKIFIETGSYVGGGIQQALDAGFNNVLSIELSDKYYKICEERFKSNNKVKIFKGESYEVLSEIMKSINEPCTFWLDGHHSAGDTALGKYWVPLIQELDVIKNHKIKNHTILIDDMRCWELPNVVHGFYKEDIFNKLREINSEYKFQYLDGHQKDDILVAYL